MYGAPLCHVTLSILSITHGNHTKGLGFGLNLCTLTLTLTLPSPYLHTDPVFEVSAS